MSIQEINTDRLKLSIDNSGRKSNIELVDRLLPGLKNILQIFDEFLWGKEGLSLNLAKHGIEKAEFHLSLVSKKRIAEFNREYRGKNSATDVLSFPVHQGLREKDLDGKFESFLINMGDIFICSDVAKVQAAQFKIAVEDEIYHLLVHGFLHLCGFDHETTTEEEEIMAEVEDKMVWKIFQNGVE